MRFLWKKYFKGDCMVEPFVPFMPMEPKTCREAFDDRDTGFQVKWDGVRILAHIKDGQVQLYNRKKTPEDSTVPRNSPGLKISF